MENDPLALFMCLKLLVTAIRAIGLLRCHFSPNGLLANDKLFFLLWNRKLNNNICDTGNEYQAQRNERSFVLKFILAYNIDILTETNIPMKELPQTNYKNNFHAWIPAGGRPVGYWQVGLSQK